MFVGKVLFVATRILRVVSPVSLWELGKSVERHNWPLVNRRVDAQALQPNAPNQLQWQTEPLVSRRDSVNMVGVFPTVKHLANRAACATNVSINGEFI